MTGKEPLSSEQLLRRYPCTRQEKQVIRLCALTTVMVDRYMTVVMAVPRRSRSIFSLRGL